MDLDTLKQILDLVREHELSELEVEQDGLRLKIRKDSAVALAVPPPHVAAAFAPMRAGPPPPAAPTSPARGAASNLTTRKSSWPS